MKRHESLQPLSREHHHGLLLCWKIRTGFTKGIAEKRIRKYADWFFDRYLTPHFEAEEKYIFPILGENHKMIKKALAEHKRIRRLFSDQNEIVKSLNRIEEELDRHIRFEERTLFPKIQEIATDDDLKLIDDLHHETAFIENTSDEFWK